MVDRQGIHRIDNGLELTQIIHSDDGGLIFAIFAVDGEGPFNDIAVVSGWELGLKCPR